MTSPAALELVQLFLEHGADASSRDSNGLTAADHARTDAACAMLPSLLRAHERGI